MILPEVIKLRGDFLRGEAKGEPENLRKRNKSQRNIEIVERLDVDAALGHVGDVPI